jgi:hypothetical protein
MLRCSAPRLMKGASPLDKGNFSGVLGVTRNLVWVVDRGPIRRFATLSQFDPSPTNGAHQPPPPWPLAPASSHLTTEGR